MMRVVQPSRSSKGGSDIFILNGEYEDWQRERKQKSVFVKMSVRHQTGDVVLGGSLLHEKVRGCSVGARTWM